jgi:hypothetical protein
MTYLAMASTAPLKGLEQVTDMISKLAAPGTKKKATGADTSTSSAPRRHSRAMHR